MTGTTEGMVGGGYYDAHSTFQADVAASGAALLEAAVDAVRLPADGKVTVADYGCGEGRNSMAMIQSALGLLAARGAVGPAVLHNDVPTNDWAGLAANLSGADSYLRQFPDARAVFAPHGFFERVTLPASITLGTYPFDDLTLAVSHLLAEILQSDPRFSADYFVGRWTPVAGGHIALGCVGALAVTLLGKSYHNWLGSRATLTLAVALYARSLVPALPHDHLRPFGLGLIIIWVYFNQQSRITQILEFRPLVYLGTISYGIYMYQGFFLSTGPYRLVGQDWPPDPLIGLILLCIVAPLSYQYLEQPILRLKSKFSASQTPYLKIPRTWS